MFFAARMTLPGLAAVRPTVGGPRSVLCIQIIRLAYAKKQEFLQLLVTLTYLHKIFYG